MKKTKQKKSSAVEGGGEIEQKKDKNSNKNNECM